MSANLNEKEAQVSDHGDPEAYHAQSAAKVGSSASAEASDFGFSPAEQKRIIRRIDRRLVLTIGALYCVSLMDRTNLGAANIAGMSTELGLGIGDRYVSILPHL